MSWIDVCKIFPSDHSQLVTQRLYAMSKRCLIFDLWKRFWVDVYITSSYGWLLDDLDRRPKNFHCQTILSWSHNVHDRPPTDVIWRFVAHWDVTSKERMSINHNLYFVLWSKKYCTFSADFMTQMNLHCYLHVRSWQGFDLNLVF